jgi:hypothetical protein
VDADHESLHHLVWWEDGIGILVKTRQGIYICNESRAAFVVREFALEVHEGDSAHSMTMMTMMMMQRAVKDWLALQHYGFHPNDLACTFTSEL